MAATANHLDEVSRVVEVIADLGLQPVLVGGMALVALGSRRVGPATSTSLSPLLAIGSFHWKTIARTERTAPGDAEDIAFLEARLKGPH